MCEARRKTLGTKSKGGREGVKKGRMEGGEREREREWVRRRLGEVDKIEEMQEEKKRVGEETDFSEKKRRMWKMLKEDTKKKRR